MPCHTRQSCQTGFVTQTTLTVPHLPIAVKKTDNPERSRPAKVPSSGVCSLVLHHLGRWLAHLVSDPCLDHHGRLIIERSITLQRRKILPPGMLEEVVTLHRNRQLNAEMVGRVERSSPLGRVLAAGLRHEFESREMIKDAMEESGRAVAHDLERFLPTLGTLATVAPLLGLFGTVIGMIEIFGSQAPSGNDPTQLAHGISIALYNTAFGIGVAIPALLAYRGFRSRVDDFLVEMEQQSLRLVDVIKGIGGRH